MYGEHLFFGESLANRKMCNFRTDLSSFTFECDGAVRVFFLFKISFPTATCHLID